MTFEIGKCYRHTAGSEMKIIGEADSTLFGKTLIGENCGKETQMFTAVGRAEDHAVNWTEITEEEWMKNFS
jgi:hypothetical protein